MSNSSNASLTRRVAKRGKSFRGNTNKLPHVSHYDAYTYALRAAYLHHLLQPKARRLQHEALPRPPLQRTATSVTDLVRDSFIVRDVKSTRLPGGFMAALDKRLTGILYGTEKMPEYQDSTVRRTFAVFFNEFKKPEFRRSADKDRKMEDLLLIFFSNATKELSKSRKSPEDDSWKLMVDRHVALFVRLASSILKANDWAREKPELASRLQTLESKLLMHDKDLSSAAQRNDGQGGTTIEVEVPRSQFVKDMPMVQTVAAVFGKDLAQAQMDINDQKEFWNEKGALRDLKMYQTSISLRNRQTLRPDDFDTDAAYEFWRKVETQDTSQMVLAIIQSSPGLAKTTGGVVPNYRTVNGSSNGTSSHVSSPSVTSNKDLSLAVDQGLDLRNLNLSDELAPSPGAEMENEEPYMFIPPDPRAYYRQLLMDAMIHDNEGSSNGPNRDGSTNAAPGGLLANQSFDMLKEISSRWRVPRISRLILFKDVLRELLSDQKIDYETLDSGLMYAKDPPWDKKMIDATNLLDHTQWPTADFVLNQQTLSAIHDIFLRDLFEQLQQCYNVRPPEIGPIMALLDSHVYEDPLCNRAPADQEDFSEHLRDALYEKARDMYGALAQQHLRKAEGNVEFSHVMELGQATVKQAERIQKRYRKNPELMGVKPAVIFIETVLPAYASDARDNISSILEQAKDRGEELPIEDGFELYKAMVDMRGIHEDVLPNVPFAFQVEDLLAPFVWRWITSTDQNMIGWVEAAIRQDEFKTRGEDPNQPPAQDERHSVSVVDIFRSFNQVVDQILQLNWDDTYQYAKFMTALSRTIGAGLTRYCEQIERFFVSEMDRLTPEQEVQVRATRQERWVRMARDALSTTERMEPYQFLPESLVKLNNIEWAMQQLDKLEKGINVDACADVIQKRDPPQLGPKKNEKLVFTVKIIEAEDLKACDPNGLSDPYVVLGDEYQKRLAKTRVIHKNLNPRWDETVDITTQGPLNVIATIWDWDIMGDHDCAGRTSIKLDPAHFRDFLPREYWLDLDTQGRLLVRVSMEGEKDDIRFYFGRAFRTLKRTERDMTRKITDKLSAYIQFALSRRTLRNLTTQPLSMNSVSSYFQRNRPPPPPQKVAEADIVAALQPLFKYFDENFAIMDQTLTKTSMVTVMTRLWKETLSTLESLLVPPLSDKPSAQRQLNEQELEIVFRWLTELFAFFHAEGDGVPLEILKSPKYHDLKNLNFFYYEPTNNLIRESERMTVASADRARDAQARANRISAPVTSATMPFGGGGILGLPSTTRRSKTVMHSRNLGTMRKAKEDKRRETQAEPSDDMILRILRMRPEAERYLRDRSRQKERLAANAAAEMIVQQSLLAGKARERERERMGGQAGGGAGGRWG